MDETERINTLEELGLAAKCRQAVVCPNSGAWYKPHPAAFVLNLQGSVLVNIFRSGLYAYAPKKEK